MLALVLWGGGNGRSILYRRSTSAVGIAVCGDVAPLPGFSRESLLELRPDDLEGRRAIGAVVLKPTLPGGAGRTREWIAGALEKNIRPVVSACFESGVGILALAELAWSSTGDAVPAGLDTYRWLGADVVRPRIPVRAGAIRWSGTLARSHRIDAARLCEVRHDGDPLPSRRGGRTDLDDSPATARDDSLHLRQRRSTQGGAAYLRQSLLQRAGLQR